MQIDAPAVATETPPAPVEPAPVELGKNGKPKKPKKPKKPAGPKPKRQGLPKGMQAGDVTLEVALKLLELPRDIGLHPETKEMITAGIGRFGPFLKHQNVFSSIPKDDDVMTIGINRAVVVIAEAAEKRAKREAAGYKPRGFGKKKKDDKGEKADEVAAAPAPKKKAGGKKKAQK